MAEALLKDNSLRVLHEVCTKYGLSEKYELLQIEGEQHSLVFSYKVTVECMATTGIGRSKQKARNAAAEAMLHEMMSDPERKLCIEANLEELKESKNGSAVFDTIEIIGNPVGCLQELCSSRRWPPPYYALVGEDPPLNHIFTITCYVLGIKETGTGGSKKKAKKVAAQTMLNRLDEMILPTMQDDYGMDVLGQRVKDLELRYSGLRENHVASLSESFSDTVCQFYQHLRKNRRGKLDELQSVSWNSHSFSCVQFLQEIASEQKFEVTYVDTDAKSICGEYQCLVQLASLPVAVCYGRGGSPKEAQHSAALCALEYLKILTKS